MAKNSFELLTQLVDFDMLSHICNVTMPRFVCMEIDCWFMWKEVENLSFDCEDTS